MEVVKASSEDMNFLIEIFREGFKDELTCIFGEKISPQQAIDNFIFCMEVEPEGFLAARENAQVVGYIFVTRSLGKLQRSAVLKGYVFRWFWNFITGKYAISLANILKKVKNKIYFLITSQKFRTSGDAQVVNIAVSEKARGRGIGKLLLEKSLEYLKSSGAKEVRLEVRPDNEAAVKLYQTTGFVERGATMDLKGKWLVMTREL